jgi:hypothetical protein
MNWKLYAGVAAIGLGLIGTSASAATITGSVGVFPPTPFGVVDFGTGLAAGKQATTGPITVGGETFNFSGDSGIYAGDVGVSRSPFRGDLTKGYLSAEPGGTMSITFATPQTSFNMLWGSVDDYNSLSITIDGLTYTGSDIAAAIGGVSFGTSDAAVMFSGLGPFTTIDIASTSAAFEFDIGTPTSVPEPASLAVLGMGLLGLGFIRRRRA